MADSPDLLEPPTDPPAVRWPTVVFDLDGTLADTVGLIVASYQHTFRTHLGKEEDEALIRSWIGRPLIQAFREHAPEHAEALYRTYLDWNRDNTERLIKGYLGVPEMLAGLQRAGIRVGVATSKLREPAKQAMQILGIAPYVQILVALEDSAKHKPDPAPLLLAVERLGGTPEHAIYIGDAVVDIKAGHAAGMATAAVTWGAGQPAELEAAHPDVVANSAHELAEYLLQPAKSP